MLLTNEMKVNVGDIIALVSLVTIMIIEYTIMWETCVYIFQLRKITLRECYQFNKAEW